MGILRWLRGGDENGAAASAISAGLAEIDGLFRPSKHKQTEHIEESKRRRIDVANGAGIDLDNNVAVIRRKIDADSVDAQSVDAQSVDAVPVEGDEVADRDGDELHGDGGQQQAGDAGEHLDPARP
jgi:hypothetical protein